MSWRTGCIAFALLSAVLAWRTCTRTTRAAPTAAACAALAEDDGSTNAPPRLAADDSDPWRDRGAGGKPARKAGGADDDAEEEGPAGSFSMPAWLLLLGPQPGESLLAYRDRMVPLAQQVIAPHRARVAKSRDAFAAAVGLDSGQRAELDAAVAEAADSIQGRLYEGIVGGDLNPSRMKPMAGVTAARDVLDAVDRANRRFLTSLRDDQRALLARHPFDLADYLLFSTRWEDALGYSE